MQLTVKSLSENPHSITVQFQSEIYFSEEAGNVAQPLNEKGAFSNLYPAQRHSTTLLRPRLEGFTSYLLFLASFWDLI